MLVASPPPALVRPNRREASLPTASGIVRKHVWLQLIQINAATAQFTYTGRPADTSGQSDQIEKLIGWL